MAPENPLSDITTPDWAKHAVFYQIFPDRFAQSPSVAKPPHLEPWDAPPTNNGFKGGDLLGIAEHLDYLAGLGVNALYLNPIFQSTANHRYIATDYYQVDPILGGNGAFRRFLDQAHHRGMRVILDGVFNHTSRGFFPFAHILENGPASPYLDWYTVKGFPLNAYSVNRAPNYACWWNLRALPKLNTANPEVREYLLQVGRYWIEQGADGWRLDVPNEIDDDCFWQEFRRRVQGRQPRRLPGGRDLDPRRALAPGRPVRRRDELRPGQRLPGLLRGGRPRLGHHPGTGYSHIHALDAAGFARAIDDLLSLYPPAVTQCQFNLIGSHDTARLLTMARNDESAVRLCLLFLMTFPGAPCIYYGDEIGMTGGKDPDCRGGFPWAQSRWRQDLLAYTRRCIALRHAHPALRTGEFLPLQAEAGVYAFARRLGGETLVVAFNTSRGRRVRWPCRQATCCRRDRRGRMPWPAARRGWRAASCAG